MKKFVQEFKVFIKRGNVLDLAVALLLGTAFTAIVQSVANDLIMPIVSMFLSGIGLKQLKWILRPADVENNITEIAIHYGNFLQAVINFLILALCVFIIVKIITKSLENINEINARARLKYEKRKRKLDKKGVPEEKQPSPPPVIEKEESVEDLLKEIRDLLKEKDIDNDKKIEIKKLTEEKNINN